MILRTKSRGLLAAGMLAGVLTGAAVRGVAADAVVRLPEEDVNSATVRQRQHLAPNTNLLHTGWGLTPAGEHVPIGDMALKLVVAPDGKAVIALCAGYRHVGVNIVGLGASRTVQFIPMKSAFNGLAFNADGAKFYATSGDRGLIYVCTYESGKAALQGEVAFESEERPVFLAGLAVHPSTGAIYVCNEANHEIWELHPQTLKIDRVIAVGQHPHSCVMGADRRHLYVSNWGSRSVSVIDTRTARRVRELTVGIRPNDMALGSDGRLFVACAGDNTVHVLTTAKLEPIPEGAGPARPLWAPTREIINTSLYPQSPEGATPCGVAVSPDGKTLFVANADQNGVMVVDISGSLSEETPGDEKISVVNGFIPVGWYPTAVAVSPDNKHLLVADGKGLTTRASWPSKNGFGDQSKGIGFWDSGGRVFDGQLSFIPRPDSGQMAAYTMQVRRNSAYRPEHLVHASLPSDSVIPARPGQAGPIKYVIYIIKENRTYDQILGDLTDGDGKPLGNGDPKLTMYGEKVTPNQHALAREYVLLDNLFSNSEVSVDGHSWCDAAIATDFNQRSWVTTYSKHGKLPGNEEMQNPVNGYLWDLCRRHGVSFKTYGEGAQRVPSANRGKWPLARDTVRVKGWIEDLNQAEKTGDLPRFQILALDENHTRGTQPGAYTPDACVANNDLALGQILQAASASRFWKEMAIFVIEDDTQNGPDHVDAHRTVGFVISPYCKRHFVDSTLYTTASMLRTMELILGLPPLTQYDAGATPMFNCFSRGLEPSVWATLQPGVNLDARNTAKSPYARQSRKMNFSAVDLAPEDELNRILWSVAKPGEPYPAPIHRALFTRPLEQ